MKRAHKKHANKIAATCVAVAMTFAAGVAVAGVTKPGDVKFDDNKVATSLSGMAGDAAKGKLLFSNRKLGNCLACHVNKDLADKPFHGEIGPPLDGVAGRYSVPEMRAILVNSKLVLSEDTIMPGFYQPDAGARVIKKFKGKTILSAQQIEDIIAYLQTLKK